MSTADMCETVGGEQNEEDERKVFKLICRLKL